MTPVISFREKLSRRLNKSAISEIASQVQGTADAQSLYRLLFDEDQRVSDNAAWVLNQFDPHGDTWLYANRNELVEETIRTTSTTKRFLLLRLLLRFPFTEETFRTDLLDFCLDHMCSVSESAAVRSLCIKIAYGQCRPFPELCSELRLTLEPMEQELLPPAVRAVRRNLLPRLGKG